MNQFMPANPTFSYPPCPGSLRNLSPEDLKLGTIVRHKAGFQFGEARYHRYYCITDLTRPNQITPLFTLSRMGHQAPNEVQFLARNSQELLGGFYLWLKPLEQINPATGAPEAELTTQTPPRRGRNPVQVMDDPQVNPALSFDMEGFTGPMISPSIQIDYAQAERRIIQSLAASMGLPPENAESLQRNFTEVDIQRIYAMMRVSNDTTGETLPPVPPINSQATVTGRWNAALGDAIPRNTPPPKVGDRFKAKDKDTLIEVTDVGLPIITALVHDASVLSTTGISCSKVWVDHDFIVKLSDPYVFKNKFELLDGWEPVNKHAVPPFIGPFKEMSMSIQDALALNRQKGIPTVDWCPGVTIPDLITVHASLQAEIVRKLEAERHLESLSRPIAFTRARHLEL